jgi:hypothetical protein
MTPTMEPDISTGERVAATGKLKITFNLCLLIKIKSRLSFI